MHLPAIGHLRAAASPKGWTLALGMVLFLLLAGCTFERRDDLEPETNGRGTLPAEELSDPDPIQSAVRSLRAFREAVAVGDLSLALALIDRDAVVIDALVSTQPEVTRGELLLELRRLHGEGLALEVIDSEAVLVGDAALVFTRIAVLRRAAGSQLAVEEGRARETALLTREDGGWRIRHFHRSLDADH